MRVTAIHDRSDSLYTLSIEYPTFDGFPALSAEVSSYVNQALAEFKSTAPHNWAARIATAPPGSPRPAIDHPFTFQASWEPAQINHRAISFIVRLYWFSGGAHGDDQLRTFNYDPAVRKDISLADLFPKDRNYLETVARAARTSLTESLQDRSGDHAPAEMIEHGTEPTAENFNNFTFNDDSITLYFQKYQVAPGYFGPQSVMLPRGR